MLWDVMGGVVGVLRGCCGSVEEVLWGVVGAL